MKVIAVFGRKGGSGKTMVSHFLAHGMSMLNYTTIMLQTDVRTSRPAEILEGRSYMLASIRGDPGSDITLIQKVVDQVEAIPNSVLIIDGGANRRNLDLALVPLADIVLVPTGYSPEDLAVAEADFWELTNGMAEAGSKAEAFIIMNRWPGIVKKLHAIHQKGWVREFLVRAERQRNLFPFFVPDMPSLLDMANADSPRYTPLIDGKARGFARIVATKVGLTGHDDEDEGGGSSDAVSAFDLAAANDGGEVDDGSGGDEVVAAVQPLRKVAV